MVINCDLSLFHIMPILSLVKLRQLIYLISKNHCCAVPQCFLHKKTGKRQRIHGK